MGRGQGKGGFNSNTKKMFLGEHNLSKNNIQGHRSSSRKTEKHIAQIISTSPAQLALDFHSKIFGQIKLREFKSALHTKEDVVRFFDGLTTTKTTINGIKLVKPISEVRIYMDDCSNPTLKGRSLMVILNGEDVRHLSAKLVLTCLPFPVKEKFELIKDEYKKLKAIFSSYGIKITLKPHSS